VQTEKIKNGTYELNQRRLLTDMINQNKQFLESKHTRFLFIKETSAILTENLTESHFLHESY